MRKNEKVFRELLNSHLLWRGSWAMGSGGGVALGFVAQPVAGEASLELLDWEGDSADAPVIAACQL